MPHRKGRRMSSFQSTFQSFAGTLLVMLPLCKQLPGFLMSGISVTSPSSVWGEWGLSKGCWTSNLYLQTSVCKSGSFYLWLQTSQQAALAKLSHCCHKNQCEPCACLALLPHA